MGSNEKPTGRRPPRGGGSKRKRTAKGLGEDAAAFKRRGARAGSPALEEALRRVAQMAPDEGVYAPLEPSRAMAEAGAVAGMVPIETAIKIYKAMLAKV